MQPEDIQNELTDYTPLQEPEEKATFEVTTYDTLQEAQLARDQRIEEINLRQWGSMKWRNPK